MVIQSLAIQDVPSVREVARGGHTPLWEPKDFAFFLAHPHGFNFGLYQSEGQKTNVLRAYTLCLLVEGELDIISVATHMSFRSQGLATQLLSHVLKMSVVRKAFLEVDVTNKPAVALYQKLGFVVIDTRKAYYEKKRDAWLMSWNQNETP